MKKSSDSSNSLKNGRLSYWALNKFKPYPNNPRIYDDKIDQFVKIIRRHGFRVPVLATPSGEVLDGHFRLAAAQRMSLRQVPVYITEGMSPAQIKSFRIAVNRSAELAEWNPELLIEELKELDGTDDPDFDALADMTGFEADDVRDFLAVEEEETEQDEVHDLLGPGEDTEHIQDQSPISTFTDDVQFAQMGFMGLPPIRRDLLIEKPPTDLFCYSKDSSRDITNWESTVVCFYTADRQFERLWTHTAQIVTRFRNLNIAGMVTPDWSTFFGYPRAARVYNIYRARFVGRFVQEAGIPIIVNVCGTDQDADYMWDGLPKGCPLSMELQARYTKDEHARMTELIKMVFDFKPRYLLVYAPQDRRATFPLLSRKTPCPVHFVTPRMIRRRQGFNR